MGFDVKRFFSLMTLRFRKDQVVFSFRKAVSPGKTLSQDNRENTAPSDNWIYRPETSGPDNSSGGKRPRTEIGKEANVKGGKLA